MASFEESFLYLLILLLVGAGVTSQLIPRFTKRWEDRRKEREIEVEDCRKEVDIKVDITSKMAEAIAHQMASASASIS
jgi:hypothetical protein